MANNKHHHCCHICTTKLSLSATCHWQFLPDVFVPKRNTYLVKVQLLKNTWNDKDGIPWMLYFVIVTFAGCDGCKHTLIWVLGLRWMLFRSNCVKLTAKLNMLIKFQPLNWCSYLLLKIPDVVKTTRPLDISGLSLGSSDNSQRKSSQRMC